MKKRHLFLLLMILFFIISTYLTFDNNNSNKNLISIFCNLLILILGAKLPPAQFEYVFKVEDWEEINGEKCQYKIEIPKNRHKMGENPSVFVYDSIGKELLNADYTNLKTGMEIAIKKVNDGNVIICSRGGYSGKIVIK